MPGLDASIWSLIKKGTLDRPLTITYDFGSIGSGEKRGLDVAITAGVMASSTSVVGINSIVSIPLTGHGMWAAAFYGKVAYGTLESVSGYACGAEFEWAAGAAADGVINCDRAVLVLNYTDNSSQNLNNVSHKAFIQCHQYGTNKLNYLFDLPDEALAAGLLLAAGDEPADWNEKAVYVRCKYGTTDFYLIGTIAPTVD